MPDLYLYVRALFIKQIPAKGRAWLLLFKPCPNYMLADFDETYSIERLDIGLINEGSIPEWQCTVREMANNYRYLLDGLVFWHLTFMYYVLTYVFWMLIFVFWPSYFGMCFLTLNPL